MADEKMNAFVAEAKRMWPSNFKPGEPMYPKMPAEEAAALNRELRSQDDFKASSMSRGAHRVKR
jgi:hypothetical protein